MPPPFWFYSKLIFIGIFGSGYAIFGGQPAKEGEFKYMAYIAIHDDLFWCGGGILDETHIITAAHCVTLFHVNDLSVIVGEINVDLQSSVRWKVKKKIAHPKYKSRGNIPNCQSLGVRMLPWIEGPDCQMLPKNDIAILQLAEPLSLNGNISGLSVLNCNVPLFYGYKCKIAGWGFSEENRHRSRIHRLQWTELTILKPEQCRASGMSHRPNTEFCGLDVSRKSYLAGGDNGSPFVCNNILIGIVALGMLERENAIFTRVHSFRRFIRRILKKYKN